MTLVTLRDARLDDATDAVEWGGGLAVVSPTTKHLTLIDYELPITKSKSLRFSDLAPRTVINFDSRLLVISSPEALVIVGGTLAAPVELHRISGAFRWALQVQSASVVSYRGSTSGAVLRRTENTDLRVIDAQSRKLILAAVDHSVHLYDENLTLVDQINATGDVAAFDADSGRVFLVSSGGITSLVLSPGEVLQEEIADVPAKNIAGPVHARVIDSTLYVLAEQRRRVLTFDITDPNFTLIDDATGDSSMLYWERNPLRNVSSDAVVVHRFGSPYATPTDLPITVAEATWALHGEVAAVTVPERDWPPLPPHPVTDTYALAFIDTNSTRSDKAYAVSIDADGTMEMHTWAVEAAKATNFGWHRALRRWVASTAQSEVSTGYAGGIWISDTGMFPGPCPGTGWTKIATLSTSARVATGVSRDQFNNNGWCPMPDGGLAAVGLNSAGNWCLWIVAADGVTVTNTALPFNGTYSKIFCPRGGSRLFILDQGDFVSGAYYADAPYTSWTSCTGHNDGLFGTRGWAGMARRSATEILAYRSWMRYGPDSGSQSEVWRSLDNGASWALYLRPWGTYPTGASVHHRDGTTLSFVGGRWWSTNLGDAQYPSIDSTADFVTWVGQTFPGRGYNPWAIPIEGDRVITNGRVPAAGWNGYGNIVFLTRDGGNLLTYDDAAGQFPAPIPDVASAVVNAAGMAETSVSLPAGSYRIRYQSGAFRFSTGPDQYAATRAAMSPDVGVEVFRNGGWVRFNTTSDAASSIAAAEALGAGKTLDITLTTSQTVKFRVYDATSPELNSGTVTFTIDNTNVLEGMIWNSVVMRDIRPWAFELS